MLIRRSTEQPPMLVAFDRPAAARTQLVRPTARPSARPTAHQHAMPQGGVRAWVASPVAARQPRIHRQPAVPHPGGRRRAPRPIAAAWRRRRWRAARAMAKHRPCGGGRIGAGGVGRRRRRPPGRAPICARMSSQRPRADARPRRPGAADGGRLRGLAAVGRPAVGRAAVECRVSARIGFARARV